MTQKYYLSFDAPLGRDGKPAWLNANQRNKFHWAEWAERVKQWRYMARHWAQQQDLPKGFVKVHVRGYVHRTDNRAYDAHNYSPTFKAVMDGLVDYGLIFDDNNKHLIGPDPREGEKREKAGVTIELTPIEE